MLKEDIATSLFSRYEYYETSAGINLSSTEEALQFSASHMMMHLGISRSLYKLVKD